MKVLARNALLMILLVVSLVPAVMAGAQGDGDDSALMMPYAAFYYLPVSGGSMADQGDGAYRLTLAGVPEIVLAFASGEIGMNRVATHSFISAWVGSAELTAAAELQASEVVIQMTLSAPIYSPEAGTLAFTARDITFDAPPHIEEPKDGWPVPAEFGGADLVIGATLDFQVARAESISTMAASIRDDNPCRTIYQPMIDDAILQLENSREQLQADYAACQGGDTNACATATQDMLRFQEIAIRLNSLTEMLSNCLQGGTSPGGGVGR
ncbi:MAG: hypothetical protein JXQ72_09110 [Anaerolineae bacterium]|nr:hypothetical protein [Anaerolineae bacterium]